MGEYRLIFITGKGNRKGPSFDSKRDAVEYGEKIRNIRGTNFKVWKVATK